MGSVIGYKKYTVIVPFTLEETKIKLQDAVNRVPEIDGKIIGSNRFRLNSSKKMPPGNGLEDTLFTIKGNLQLDSTTTTLISYKVRSNLFFDIFSTFAFLIFIIALICIYIIEWTPSNSKSVYLSSTQISVLLSIFFLGVIFMNWIGRNLKKKGIQAFEKILKIITNNQ